MRGKIKWFDPEKGYGFITGEDRMEYFFHFTGLSPNATLIKDINVEFEPMNSEKGLHAKNVSPEELANDPIRN